MNLSAALTLYSLRRELLYIVLTFFIVLVVLPLITFEVITNTGIEIVSKVLVASNPILKTVDLLNPSNGKVWKSLSGPFVMPIVGKTTLEFGEVDLPYQPLHTGIDISTTKGTPIVPFMAGVVASTDELNWGYGRYIIVDHGDNVTSLYGHLDKVFVKTGDKVSTNVAIGTEGSTGWSTGPHLHFEVRVFGIPVNPRTFMIE